MKSRGKYRVLLAVMILVFAAYALTPCLLRYTSSPLAHADLDGLDDVGLIDCDGESYAIPLTWPISLAELILVLAVKKRRGWRIVGFVLNLIKTVLPLPLLQVIGPVFANAGDSWNRYSFSASGYLILFIGLIIAILYIADFVHIGKRAD